MHRRTVRSATLSAVCVVIAVGVSGCFGPAASVPTPTPTGFASEEEAYAAAEATYRAYVDALNRVDLADPETFEDVYAWLSGAAYAEERKGLTNRSADGQVVSGEMVVQRIDGFAYDAAAQTMSIHVCVDVSGIDVVDSDGATLVAPDRLPVQSVRVSLLPYPNGTGARIAELTGADEEDAPCEL